MGQQGSGRGLPTLLAPIAAMRWTVGNDIHARGISGVPAHQRARGYRSLNNKCRNLLNDR